VFTIRFILLFVAVFILLYPIWGIIDPTSYLNEFIEKFPFAEGASDEQIRKSSLILILSNSLISISFIFIVKFISKPNSYIFAKISAATLIIYPIFQNVCDVFIGNILSQHTQDVSISVGLSSQNIVYLLFGLIIFGISNSQCEHNKPIKQGC